MENRDSGGTKVEGKIETETTGELISRVLEVCGGEKPEEYGSTIMTREIAEVVVEAGLAKHVIEEQEKAYAVDHKRYWHQWMEDDRGKADRYWEGVRCPWSTKIAEESRCARGLRGGGYDPGWKVLKEKNYRPLSRLFLEKYGFSQSDVMAKLEEVDADYQNILEFRRANSKKRSELKKQIDELLLQVEQIKKLVRERKTNHTADETQKIIRLNHQALQLKAEKKALEKEIADTNRNIDPNKAWRKVYTGMREVLKIIDSKK